MQQQPTDSQRLSAVEKRLKEQENDQRADMRQQEDLGLAILHRTDTILSEIHRVESAQRRATEELEKRLTGKMEDMEKRIIAAVALMLQPKEGGNG